MPCVVADTSPLFYLARLERLALLRELYAVVNIPPTVWQEALAGGRSFPEILPMLLDGERAGWLKKMDPPKLPPTQLADLDAGEREAISLAREIDADLLIIDEQLGRRAAEELGLTVTGTLGVLVEAKRKGLLHSLGDQLQRLRNETTFRFSHELEQQILRMVGEHLNP